MKKRLSILLALVMVLPRSNLKLRKPLPSFPVLGTKVLLKKL